MTDGFDPCEICGGETWKPVFSGQVRDGAFGSLTHSAATVARCGGCGVERLDEAHVRGEDIYQGAEYRALVGEAVDAEGFFAEHDILQLRNLQQLWPHSLRGAIIADVGCAAGSFLDHVAGLVSCSVAIEPCREYHESLRERGHEVFSTLEEAHGTFDGNLDWVFSFSVIEHVADPRAFLSGIAALLKPGGHALVSTPNRQDILMGLLPEEYPAFFYRTVHRWYFDPDSLHACSAHAGLFCKEMKVAQRFGLSNTLFWLRDKAPNSGKPLPPVDSPVLDAVWRAHLTQTGTGDYLYALLAVNDA